MHRDTCLQWWLFIHVQITCNSSKGFYSWIPFGSALCPVNGEAFGGVIAGYRSSYRYLVLIPYCGNYYYYIYVCIVMPF